jgi:hypothetical protein
MVNLRMLPVAHIIPYGKTETGRIIRSQQEAPEGKVDNVAVDKEFISSEQEGIYALRVLLTVYKTIILPVVLYGCEIDCGCLRTGC